MGNIKFYLNTGKGTEKARPIMVSYHFNSLNLRYYTGLRIAENEFNSDSKDLPALPKCSDRIYINGRLKMIRNFIGEIENEIIAGGEILTPGILRERLDIRLKQKPVVIVGAVTFMQVFDMYIERCKVATNAKTGHKLSKALPIKYNTIKNMLKDFNTYRGSEVDFEDFNKTVYIELVSYMLDVKDYSVNTYGRAIRFIKTVLQYGFDEGYNTNIKFKSVFKSVSEDADSIYLTETELEALYKKDLSKNLRLEKVRDLFLIGCWTGLRFSDYTTLKKSDIEGERLRVKTQKTKQIVLIPMHPTVKAIIEKYNYQLPKPISNQKFNEYIREVAKEIDELKTPFTKNITKGGETVSKPMLKWEAVSSHVARRSFASNAVKRKIEPLLIMSITGHRTAKEFSKYVKISEEEMANLFESQAKWQ